MSTDEILATSGLLLGIAVPDRDVSRHLVGDPSGAFIVLIATVLSQNTDLGGAELDGTILFDTNGITIPSLMAYVTINE